MGRCEVQNGVGEMSKTIFLDVQVPVYFEVSLSNQSFCANFACLPSSSRFPILTLKFCISPLWHCCGRWGRPTGRRLCLRTRRSSATPLEISPSLSSGARWGLDRGCKTMPFKNANSRGAGRFTATPRGFPSSKQTPPPA